MAMSGRVATCRANTCIRVRASPILVVTWPTAPLRRGAPAVSRRGSGADLVIEVGWVVEIVHSELCEAGVARQLLERPRRQTDGA